MLFLLEIFLADREDEDSNPIEHLKLLKHPP